jgi:hypothetical protein
MTSENEAPASPETKSSKKFKFSTPIGLGLLVAGVVMIITIFYFAIEMYLTYLGPGLSGEDLLTAIVLSANELIKILVKLAFLGLGLAAAATLLKYGVRILQGRD